MQSPRCTSLEQSPATSVHSTLHTPQVFAQWLHMVDWYRVSLQREASQCPHLSAHGLQTLHLFGQRYPSGSLCSSQFNCVILLQFTLSLQVYDTGGVAENGDFGKSRKGQFMSWLKLAQFDQTKQTERNGSPKTTEGDNILLAADDEFDAVQRLLMQIWLDGQSQSLLHAVKKNPFDASFLISSYIVRNYYQTTRIAFWSLFFDDFSLSSDFACNDYTFQLQKSISIWSFH